MVSFSPFGRLMKFNIMGVNLNVRYDVNTEFFAIFAFSKTNI